MRSYVKNAADPEQVHEAKARVRLRDDQATEDVRWILSTRQGRRFVWKILERSRIHALSFDEESARKSDFNEGKRSIGNQLLAELMSIRPDAYIEMMKESEEDNA